VAAPLPLPAPGWAAAVIAAHTYTDAHAAASIDASPSVAVAAATAGPAALLLARTAAALSRRCPRLPLARAPAHASGAGAVEGAGAGAGPGVSAWAPLPPWASPGSRHWPLAPRWLLPALPFAGTGFLPAWAVATAVAAAAAAGTGPEASMDADAIIAAAAAGAVEVIPDCVAVCSETPGGIQKATAVDTTVRLLKPDSRRAGGAVVCPYCAAATTSSSGSGSSNGAGGNDGDDNDDEILTFPVFASQFVPAAALVSPSVVAASTAPASTAAAGGGAAGASKNASGTGGVKFSFARSNRTGVAAAAAAAVADRSRTAGSGAVDAASDAATNATGDIAFVAAAAAAWVSTLPIDVVVGYRCSKGAQCPGAAADAAAAAAAVAAAVSTDPAVANAAAPSLGAAAGPLLAQTLALRVRAADWFYRHVIPAVLPYVRNDVDAHHPDSACAPEPDAAAAAAAVLGGRLSPRDVPLLPRAVRAAAALLAGSRADLLRSPAHATAAADASWRRANGSALRALLHDAGALLDDCNAALGASHFIFSVLHADLAVLTALSAGAPAAGAGAAAAGGGRAPVDAATSARYALDVALELCAEPHVPSLEAAAGASALAPGGDSHSPNAATNTGSAAGPVAALRPLSVALLARAWQGAAAVDAAHAGFAHWWPAAALRSAPAAATAPALTPAAAGAAALRCSALPFALATDCAGCRATGHAHARVWVRNGRAGGRAEAAEMGTETEKAGAEAAGTEAGGARWLELPLHSDLAQQATPAHDAGAAGSAAASLEAVGVIAVKSALAAARCCLFNGDHAAPAGGADAQQPLLLPWRAYASCTPVVCDDGVPPPGVAPAAAGARFLPGLAGADGLGHGLGLGGSLRSLAQALAAQHPGRSQ
jgi:hypothetical protein